MRRSNETPRRLHSRWPAVLVAGAAAGTIVVVVAALTRTEPSSAVAIKTDAVEDTGIVQTGGPRLPPPFMDMRPVQEPEAASTEAREAWAKQRGFQWKPTPWEESVAPEQKGSLWERLEQRFEREPVDKNWASQRLETLRAAVQAAHPEESRLVKAGCGTTLCELVLQHDREVDRDHIEYTLRPAIGWDATVAFDEETRRSTVFVAREGWDLNGTQKGESWDEPGNEKEGKPPALLAPLAAAKENSTGVSSGDKSLEGARAFGEPPPLDP